MVRTLSQDKREKYLRAALSLFVQKGVQNTSTADIAIEAGTAAGTLFLYFPTKQNLIDELLRKIARDYAESIKSQLTPGSPAREALFIIWNESIRWLRDHLEAYQFQQQVRNTGMVTEPVLMETASYFSFYYEAIQKGLQEGSIKPYRVDLIGGFLYQGIAALMGLIMLEQDSDIYGKLIEQGFEIFWNGIKTEEYRSEPTIVRN